MTHNEAMGALYDATGKTITIGGEDFTVKTRRMTYGAGLALTLDRPLAGKFSRLFIISNNDRCLSVKIAKTIA
jgi:hypothetical protein